MKQNRHALIFSTVWPEPDSSAAGVRQMQWIRILSGAFERVTLISPSRMKNEGDWGVAGYPSNVSLHSLELNRSGNENWIAETGATLVLFDRFILEEQFGHLVYENLPDALCLLETQDLHFLRRLREVAKDPSDAGVIGPQARYETDTALREIASIQRVDHSFLVSSFESRLLREVFQMGPGKQSWLPFFYENPRLPGAGTPFEERSGFVWIGNFRHAPNADGLRWLKREIWPEIKKRQPSAKLRVYGAYPSQEFSAWNSDSRSGIEVPGQVRELDEVFKNARVNLATLRFGAGVKGKLFEGFRGGVPAVTTPVGAEGLAADSFDLDFPGVISGDARAIAEGAVLLHEDQSLWLEKSGRALRRMVEIHSEESVLPGWVERVQELLEKKKAGVLPLFQSRLMRHELNSSRKYFSKWIEEKEKQSIQNRKQ